MDSGSDEESMNVRRPTGKVGYRPVIDSDSESNTSNQSSSESSSGTPVQLKKKKSARKVLDSDTDSDTDSEEDEVHSTENSGTENSDIDNDTVRLETDTSYENVSAIDRSRRHPETADVSVRLANMSIRNKDEDEVEDEDEDIVIPESDDEVETSLIQSQGTNGSDSDDLDEIEASVLATEGESEAEQEEQRQCFSPRTRRSITGHRPKDLLTSDESDDESFDNDADDVDDGEIAVSPIYKYDSSAVAHSIDDENQSKKRGRKLFQSFALNESVIRTPQPKRPASQNNMESTMATASTSRYICVNDQSVSTNMSAPNGRKSIFQLNSPNDESSVVHEIDDNDDDSQELHTIIGKSKSSNSSSVVLIDSSDDDDEVQMPNRRLTLDFKTVTNASTPQSGNLVQPKIQGLISKMVAGGNKKGVSQEYYHQNIEKLTIWKNDLEKNRELLVRLGPTLPDKGMNLKSRISLLERDVLKQQSYIDTLVIEETLPSSQPTLAAGVKPISWAEIEKGANAIQPKFTGVTGATNFAEEREAVLKSLKNAHTEMETCPAEDTLAPTPKGLKISLMPHQQYALAWMLWREKQKHPCGGILADDMGLGKTLSIIGLVLASDEIENAREDDDEEESSEDDDNDIVEEVKTNNKWASKGRRSDYYIGGTLIICPASLINQWEKEVENRVKRQYCSVRMHHGNNRETNARQLSKHTMVITTYGVINSEQKNRGALFRIRWERIVLDEAHIIRNHTTAMAQSCCDLKGKRRWCLTGTPIQNKEMDLFSLWKFLKVRGFDNLTKFKKWMQINTADGLSRLNARLRPMLLRRTKSELQGKGELQSLPDKKIENIVFALGTDEMNVYSKILTLSQSLFAQFMNQRTQRQELQGIPPQKNDVFNKIHAKFKRMQGDIEEVKSSQILVLLTRLRQICDHPGLIDAMLQDEDVAGSDDSEDEQLKELDLLAQINNLNINENNEMNNNSNDGENHLISRASSKVLLRSNPVFDFNRQSSKCRKVLEIIQNIQSAGDDKIVVVSQWTSVLNILAKFLNRRNLNFVELNGKTQIKLRNDIVVNFNKPTTPQRIMLLSLVAGGVGLNLTGANHLILVDPHWNPQLEAQAFDRVYRVGQSKPVQIYKLLCENTVEMGIKLIQDRKLNLSENVLTGSKNGSASKLSFQDLCQLFQM